MKRNYKSIAFLSLILLLISCSDQLNYLEPGRHGSINQSSTNIKSPEANTLSSYPEIEGTWERVGNSGHARDIVARGSDIYIVGTNNKVYYYDSSLNDWIREPGGGHGKMISMTNNNQTLIVRGNDDRVYKKPKGKNSSWKRISDFKIRDLSGPIEYSSTLSISPDRFFTTSTAASIWEYNYGSWTEHIVSNNPLGTTGIWPQFIALNNSVEFPVVSGAKKDIYGFVYYPHRLVQIFKTQNPEGDRYKYIYRTSPEPTATDVALIGDTLWFIGLNDRIYRLPNYLTAKEEDGTLEIVATGHAKRISVNKNGEVYIIGTDNKIYKLNRPR